MDIEVLRKMEQNRTNQARTRPNQSKLECFLREGLCLVLSVKAQKSTVAKARRIHLLPCRTQKLSFLTPKVVGGQLPARKGSCRAHGGLAQQGEHLPYKQDVTGSSPVSSIESLAQLV